MSGVVSVGQISEKTEKYSHSTHIQKFSKKGNKEVNTAQALTGPNAPHVLLLNGEERQKGHLRRLFLEYVYPFMSSVYAGVLARHSSHSPYHPQNVNEKFCT